MEMKIAFNLRETLLCEINNYVQKHIFSRKMFAFAFSPTQLIAELGS